MGTEMIVCGNASRVVCICETGCGVVGCCGSAVGDGWKVVRRFADVGLGNIEVREGEKDMLRLHDLIHDFAVVCAKSAGEVGVWHRRLLEGYGEVVGVDKDGGDGRDGGGCREWWKVESDEYMFRNVSRHFVGGERVSELERVLMRGEWAMARRRGGGAGLWKEDFCRWAEGIEKWKKKMQVTEDVIGEIEVRKRGLWLIRDAMLESWGYLSRNGSEFGFQMWGRLVREANKVVQEFLKSVGECQGRPWLKPLTPIWPRPGSRKVSAELFLGGHVKCISWVGGSKYAVGVWREVVVVDVEDMQVVSRCGGHSDRVLGVIRGVKSGRLVSCSRDETVRQWDVESGKQLDMVRLEYSAGNEIGSGYDELQIACFSVDGTVVVGGWGYGRVDMWNAATGKIMRRSVMDFEGSVLSIVVSASGRCVSGGSRNGQGPIWGNVMKQAVPLSADNCPSDVRGVAFRPDEKLLITGHKDGTVRFSSVGGGCQGGELLDVGSQILSLAFSSDGQQLAVGTPTEVQTWKVGSWKRVSTIPFGRYGGITCVGFSQNDEYLLAGNSDGQLRVIDVGRTPKEDEELTFGHTDAVTFICPSPDRSYFVSGSVDGMASVWDANRQVRRGPALEHDCTVHCGDESADSRLIATGCEDGTVRIWDARECKQIGGTLRGHSALVKSVAFSPDGRLLISGSSDGTVRIRNMTKKAQIVNGIGKRVAVSGIGEGTASEVEWNEDQEWDRFQCDDSVECVAVMPGGKRVICSTFGGTMFMWDIAAAKFVCEKTGPDFGASHIQFREENRVFAVSKVGPPSHWYINEHRGLVPVPEDEEEDMTGFFGMEDCEGRYKEIVLTRDPWELRWREDGRTLGTLLAKVWVSAWVYDERSGIIVTGDEDGQVNFYQLIK